METIASATGDEEIRLEKLMAIQTAEARSAALRGRSRCDTPVEFLSRSGGEAPRAGEQSDGFIYSSDAQQTL